MLKNADMPATGHAGLAGEDRFACAPGLTKRELIAAMAMQGLLAGGWDHAGVPREGAETAVAYADHLLDTMERGA